jgi:hypothetical protein
VDNGLFLEFVPTRDLDTPAPPRHWLGTVELGVDYALIVSSCAGLWAYILGDTIKFVALDPPRVLVTGRTSYWLSAFGEHSAGEEIEEAASAAAETTRASIADFSVGAVFPGDAPQSRGGHLYLVEFVGNAPADRAAFARTIDDHLCRTNDDYRAHRAPGVGLEPPKVLIVKPGTFAMWMKSRGQLGGQHKVPRVIADPALFSELRQFVTQFLLD